MRYFTPFCVALLMVFSSQANAEDIQGTSLSAIGLSDMQQMTDTDGMNVRANGFVWGRSWTFSTVGGFDSDSYSTPSSGPVFGFSFASSGGASAGGFSFVSN